jgi:hypothetical protein
MESSVRLKPTLQGYQLTIPGAGIEISMPMVNWAGFDQMDGLIYLRGGAILRGRLDGGKLIETQLVNFDDARQPDRQPTPDWAKVW